MAVVVGEAAVRLRPETDKFAGEAEADIDKSMPGIAGKAAGFFVAAFAAVKIGQFLGDAITQASDLSESASKVGVVFGDSAGKVQAFASTAASSIGLSEAAALGATGTFGNLLRSVGLTEDASADMSTSMVSLAGDLASFNNASPEEALDALRAGLLGEAEPLKAYGVNLNQAAIQAKAVELGLTDASGAMTDSAKAQAAYALIMEQTALAQGDFSRTSGGLANQQRIVAAQTSELSANIGGLLAPALGVALQAVTGGLMPALLNLTDGLPGLGNALGAIGPIMHEAFDAGDPDALIATLDAGLPQAIGRAAADAGNLRGIFSETFADGRAGASLLAEDSLGGLAARLGVAAFAARDMGALFGEAFADGQVGADLLADQGLQGIVARAGVAGHGVIEALSGAFGTILETIQPIIAAVSTALGGLFGGGGSVNPALSFVEVVVGALGKLVAIVGPILEGVIGHYVAIFQAVMPAVVALIEALVPVISSLMGQIGPIIAQIVPIIQQVSGVLVGVLGTAIQALVPVIGPLVAAIGQVVGILAGGLLGVIQALAPVIPVLAAAIGQVASILVGALGTALQAVIPILPILAGVIAQLATILAGALAGALTAIAPVLPVLATAFGQIATILAGALMSVLAALLPILPPILEAFAQIAQVLIGALMGALTAILPLLPTLVGALVTLVLTAITPLLPLLPMLAELLATIVAAIAPLIPIVVQVVVLLVQLAVAAIMPLMPLIPIIVGLFAMIVEALGGLITIVVQVVGAWVAFAASIIGIVVGFVSAVVGFWTSLFTSITSIVGSIVTAVVGFFSDIVNKVVEIVGAFVGAIAGFFTTIATDASRIVGGIVTAVTGFFSDISTRVGDTVRGIGETVAGVWQGIVDTASSILGGVADIVTGAFSSVAGIIKGAINGVIDLANKGIAGLNNMIDTANLIPGINIPHIPNIPKLHSGGVFDSGQGEGLALLRDQELVATPEQRVVADDLLRGLLAGRLPTPAGTAAAGTLTGQPVEVNVYGAPGQDERVLAAHVSTDLSWQLSSGVTRTVPLLGVPS